MKTLAIIAFIGLFSSLGCTYYCDANKRPHCADPPPPLPGPCDNHYERWFYSPSSNECVKIAYWGCTSDGFGSKNDCEECKCHN